MFYKVVIVFQLGKGAESKFPRCCGDADEAQLPGPPVESVLKMGVFRQVGVNFRSSWSIMSLNFRIKIDRKSVV